MRTITALLLLFSLTGCTHQQSYSPVAKNKALEDLLSDASTAQKAEQPQPKKPQLPTCYSRPQCDAMWSEATSRIQTLTGMRLQVATDTYLNTYNASPGKITGEVRKIPRPDGTTIIQASFDCNYCSDGLASQARDLFTVYVKAAGEGFPEPYIAPSWDEEVRKF